MAISRYAFTPISGNHYQTFSLPVQARGYVTRDLLRGVQFHEYVFKVGDRLDTIAGKEFGANLEVYWWIIALCNNISWFFEPQPGDTLRIPNDYNDVLDKIRNGI